MTKMKWTGVATATAILMGVSLSDANDWPQYHGADRTNRSAETGLLRSWPEGGPRLLWTASGAGAGYSGVTTAGGAVYTAGSKDRVNYVFAFDRATGRQLWERRAGDEWVATRSSERAYQGSRGTPAVDGGMVYYVSDRGLLLALNAGNGAVNWSVDLLQKYSAEMPPYGYSQSPLVIGNRLYVMPFGRSHTVVCLDKTTGNVIWESGRVSGRAEYASLVPIEHDGVRQLVAFTNDNLFSVNMDNGAVLWTVPYNRGGGGLNATDILFHDGHVFATGGYGLGSMLVRLDAAGGRITPEIVYRTNVFGNLIGGVILHNGYVYGAGQGRGWQCVDFRTGEQMWNSRGSGSLTFADGMLYLYGDDGAMSLVAATPERFTQISTFQVPSGGRGANWAHPSISNGVLYLRHADKIFAYDIKNR